ncbi:hypothetical protein GALMADRAFT_1051855 [Galerina marginata CBS 339.88]|uniref:Uncharacterized protein n=1 Tax=Galerina marginata (strain CBS 339.88) TaxID=685588 RepID=A0A067SB09_GALM3|nr:hypothetical protein GALMADRAFT_1051855 [Galerina marginata CBS 339.88]
MWTNISPLTIFRATKYQVVQTTKWVIEFIPTHADKSAWFQNEANWMDEKRFRCEGSIEPRKYMSLRRRKSPCFCSSCSARLIFQPRQKLNIEF